MAEAVRCRLQARPVCDGRLGCVGYMELSYDPASPWEVRLSEGPAGGGEQVVFARELLVQALDGSPAGEGAVRARLRHLPGARHAMLSLQVEAGDGPPLEFGLSDDAVATFVARTLRQVPLGEEWQHVDLDAEASALLGEAA